MSESKKSKKVVKASSAEPAVEPEQKSNVEVDGQPKPQGEAALDGHEEMKLAQFEKIIGQNLDGFMLIGRALKGIRDGKLYRVQSKTFDDYCRERWGLSDKYAYRQINAYTCVETLQKEISPIGDNRFPTNESQVRELVVLDESKWVKAWERVLKATKDKLITAEAVKEVVAKMLGQSGNTETTPKASSTTRSKVAVKKAKQNMAKIGKLVAATLKKADSKLTVASLKQVLATIQKMIKSKN